MLPKTTMVLFCIYFYQNCFGDIFYLYIQAAGLWWKVKHIYTLNALANVVLNYMLVRLFGIWGVLIATIITSLLLGSLSLGNVLFKYYFKNYSYYKYLIRELFYVLLIVLIAFLTNFVIDILSLSNSISGFIVKTILCLCIPNIILISVFHKDELFLGMKDLMFNLGKKFWVFCSLGGWLYSTN